MTEHASITFRGIGRSEDIPNDFAVPYYLNDRKLRISIARFRRSLHLRPRGVPALRGTTIICQCHGFRFDITTGAVINGPATKALNVYEVQEIEGSVRIRA
jgi:hypothetical protein